jgi:FkbM family methyltransferase
MIYHKLLKLSRKFTSRFFLFEELSRLDSKAKIDSKLFSALYWKAFRSPSVAEDWIPLHRFIGHLGPLILVDIGANIGDFAVEYHANFPVNHVYCFEPVPATYTKLQQRLANSPFGSTAFNMAVSEHVGKVSFNIYDSSTLNSMHQYVKELTAGEQERPIPVDVLSVQAGPVNNSLILDQSSIFLKIDVQGMEVDVVRACADILDRCAAVLIEVSFLPEYEGVNPSFSPVASLLMKSGLYPVFFHDFGDKSSLYAVERDVLFVRNNLLGRAFDSSL